MTGGLAEDWVCSHAHVASGVRMREWSGREEYTVLLWAVTNVTRRAHLRDLTCRRPPSQSPRVTAS
jgi:hypothetical protein